MPRPLDDPAYRLAQIDRIIGKIAAGPANPEPHSLRSAQYAAKAVLAEQFLANYEETPRGRKQVKERPNGEIISDTDGAESS
jgi:hypothetical protein